MVDDGKPEKLAHVAGEIVRIAKDSPDARAAGANVASSLKVVTQLVKNALLPIAAVNFGISRAETYFRTKFASELADKTARIPPEDLVEPKASIAGPAMQSMAFSLDEAELRSMYLELIATAMDGKSPGGAHPAYVEIIRQLSGEEIGLLSNLLAVMSTTVIVQIGSRKIGGSGVSLVRRHVWQVVDSKTQTPIQDVRFAQWVDNWIRLRLVDVSYGLRWLSAEGAYDWAESRPEYLSAKAELPEGRELQIERGLMEATSWGVAFAKAVGMNLTKSDEPAFSAADGSVLE